MDAGEATASASSLAAAADVLDRRGDAVTEPSCFAEVVDTLEATEEDRPLLGVDLRELGMKKERERVRVRVRAQIKGKNCTRKQHTMAVFWGENSKKKRGLMSGKNASQRRDQSA